MLRPRWGDPVRISLRPLHSKTRDPVLSCCVDCVVTRLVVLIQYRRVTDGKTDKQTDRQTDGHMIMTVNTMLA